MADNNLHDLIVTMWRAGDMTYVEALRRLMALGVDLDAATRWLADRPSGPPPAPHSGPRS